MKVLNSRTKTEFCLFVSKKFNNVFSKFSYFVRGAYHADVTKCTYK